MAGDVEARLDRLEERVERRLDATEPDPVEHARHLAGVEHAVLEALHVARREDGEFAGERGHPVLAELARWRDLCEHSGAPDAAGRARDLAADLVEDQASRWRAEAFEGLGDAGPEECFRRLAEARTVDLGILMQGMADPPLANDLPRLRAAFARALEREPPGNALRREWSIELRDRVDVVLTSIDDAEPRRARAMLDRLLDDLRWHVEHVEPKGLRGARLRQRIRRLEAERQERRLQDRLERRFGTRNVARFERGILVLILLVLGLLAFETWFLSPAAEQTAAQHELVFWLTIVDTAACAAFLWEFFVKISFVRDGRWRWFARHFFVDFLPSIPFGLVMWHGADAVRYGRAVRLGRFGRLFRYVRVLRPLIRLLRAFGFLSRGIDRLARKYGGLLNRNIVLYPTREERAAMQARRESGAVRLRRLQAHVHESWESLLTGAPREARESIAVLRLDTLRTARDAGLLVREQDRAAAGRAHARDVSAETVLEALGELTPPQLEAEAGHDLVTRAARAVRLFSALRWLPLVGRYVPSVTRGMSDAEAVTAAAHRSAAELARQHDRYFWFADLYGTVTPAQFVDRVGTAMVKGAKRPAVRLLLFGLAYLVVVALLPDETRRDASSFLVKAHDALERIVGTVLKVLGAVCLAILGVGWWLCRVAGQATEFFSQSAQAQYLALTESVKARWLDRDAGILDRRVFAAERALHGDGGTRDGGTRDGEAGDGDVSGAARAAFVHGVESWLREAQGSTGVHRGFDPVERATLLYRDGLDGALLVASDTRTTSQLLGNPALRNLRRLSGRVPRRERRGLQRLDLERQKSLVRGPYLWFSLICQAVEHGVARLLVDYNRHALPLDQLENASPEERANFDNWLRSNTVEDVETDRVVYVTTEFTCLHFLDDDPERDREVEARFGPEVAARLTRDRRHLFRRLFGSYPLHNRPHDERVVNLYRVYQNWLAGGRALLIPFRVAGAALKFAGRFVVWVARCVDDIRRPRFQVDVEAVEGADFHAARRKIARMRLPVALAALRLRARFDPEYLGPTLPGRGETVLDDDAEGDLGFLGADPATRRELREERHRAGRDMVRLGRLFDGGLRERLAARLGVPASRLDAEHDRAAAVAYLGDLGYVRRHLSAKEILAEVYGQVTREVELPRRWWPLVRRRLRFRRYWKLHGDPDDREARRAAWRATAHNLDGVADALRVWADHGDAARGIGEELLADVLRHPERITEQLVTLRIVQTLSLIDVSNYREHVYRLGAYEASGDPPPPGL